MAPTSSVNLHEIKPALNGHRPTRQALVALLTPFGLLMLGCRGQSEVDVGSPWVADAPGVSSMQWTSDAQTLVYTQGDGRLNAVDLGGHSPRLLLERVGAAHLASGADGETIFFLQPAADSAGVTPEFRLAQASFGGGVLATPGLVSEERTSADFLVSPNGASAALTVSASVQIIDVATGNFRSVPIRTPLAFSPDAQNVLGSEGRDYFMTDSAGSAQPIAVPSGTTIYGISRWNADGPSTLVVDYARLLDVSSGETQALLPGIQTFAGSFAGFSGDPAQPTAAYVWQRECLHSTSVGQPPVQACDESPASLHRVVLEGGADLVVATANDVRPIAVSQDGRQLATYDDGLASGQSPHLDLKQLPDL